MFLAIRIARRYFFSKKKKTFISLIANISMLGVGVGAMALVIVLSVFNGLEDFNRQLFRTFDADLKISPRQGKTFSLNGEVFQQVRRVPGVLTVAQVLEENALLQYRGRRDVVTIRGVDDNFATRPQMDTALVEGSLTLQAGTEPFAVLGYGVAQSLGVIVEDDLAPLEVWYPRRDANLTLPTDDAFVREAIRPGGVFSIEQQYDDNYVIVPLSFAQRLFEAGNRRTALDVRLKPEADPQTVKADLMAIMGTNFQVQTPDEQHITLLRAIQIEKFIVFVTLTLIIAMASVNIYFSLSMLALDKQDDVRVLYAMGGTPALVRAIFLTEGALVAFTGAIVGLALGVLVCWLQQEFGLVKMGLVTSLVDAYPVKMQAADFVLTGLALIGITLLASYGPAVQAARRGIDRRN
ncbi:MAG: ABC transporter permease [Cytophagaceae bacterium]|nr:ABC transporter permease [Cytophagaceae bacterium]